MKLPSAVAEPAKRSTPKKRKSIVFTVSDLPVGASKSPARYEVGTDVIIDLSTDSKKRDKADARKSDCADPSALVETPCKKLEKITSAGSGKKSKLAKRKKLKSDRNVSGDGKQVDLFFTGQSEDDLADLERRGEEGEREGDEDEEDHEGFLEAMAALDGKKKRVRANRGGNEPLDENAVPSTTKVELADLLKTLDGDTRKVSRRIKGKKVLEVPLEKPALERVTRGAGYTRVRQEVGVWDAVVHSRRSADTLHFPLNRPDMRLETAAEVVKTRFTSSTPLEQQVAALLAGSKAVVQPGEELSKMEMKYLEGLTPREIAERKAELAKFRALQTYQEAKMRRQNKIKSKKFRKIARKEKSKEKLQQLEQLAQTDPEAAAEQLEQIERRRIEERASLKHRNASRFLQEQAKRAKTTKDKDIQAIVSEQLAKHRELVTKACVVSSDSEAEEEEVVIDPTRLQSALQDESYTEFSAKYRAFHQHQQERVDKARAAAKDEEEQAEDEGINELFEEAEFNLKQTVLQRLAKRREAMQEDAGPEDQEEIPDDKEDLAHAESLEFPMAKKPTIPAPKRPVGAEDLNPDDFIQVGAKKLRSDLPEIIGYNEEENSGDEGDEDEQRKTIAEAFADDDVMADFQKEKADIIAAAKPKDIDLTLPGWGEWGGGGIQPSKRKRKRFTIRAPPPEKRRDENKGHLILNVDKDEKIRAHKVSNVPFPFTSVSDFEASIRAPVGDTFLPRTAFLKMIQPKVKTKMGETILPMDKSQLVKRGIQPITG